MENTVPETDKAPELKTDEPFDPTTKEEYKQVAGEAIKTVVELQGKRN